MPLFTLAFCRLVLTYFPKPFEIQISSIHAKSLDELSLPPFLDLATWQMTCRSQCIRPIVVHDMQSVGFCDYSSLEDKETCQYNKQRILDAAARMSCQALTKTAGMHKPQKLRQSSGAGDKTYLSIKCNPDAVSITGEISPGFRANDASSNSFCMSPCPKNPLLLSRQRLRQVTRTPCVIPRRQDGNNLTLES